MKATRLLTLVVLLTLIAALLFTLNSCKADDEKYIIKGRLLQSCDSPLPISGVLLQLTYPCKTCRLTETDFGSFTTKTDGSFEFTYTGAKRANELIISGTQSNGLGTLNYVYGIPANSDINVGNVYISNNFYALVKLNVQRQTSLADTIYYVKGDNLTQPIVGPFAQNQVIDTLIFRNTQFYDKQNQGKYSNLSNFIVTYKMGRNGAYDYTGGLLEECKKYNEIVIDVK